MYKLNCFDLAKMELIREGKDPKNLSELLDKAIEIRKWVDKHGKDTAKRIMAGDKVYHYGSNIKTYARA